MSHPADNDPRPSVPLEAAAPLSEHVELVDDTSPLPEVEDVELTSDEAVENILYSLGDKIPELTPRQSLFVKEYLLDMNATQAFIRSGGDPDKAHLAQAIMRSKRVRRAIARALANRNVRIGLTADAVLHELACLSMSSLEHYRINDEGHVELTEGAPEIAMRAVQSIKRRVRETYHKDTGHLVDRSVETEIKLWDKVKPLHLLAKHVGLQVDRVEVTGPNGGPVETVTKVIREVVRAGDR
jgi:phage terminase small subunit